MSDKHSKQCICLECISKEASENSKPASSFAAPSGSVKCWCRKCKQEKREDEMFAGIIPPDGIGRGMCLTCLEKEESHEKQQRAS